MPTDPGASAPPVLPDPVTPSTSNPGIWKLLELLRGEATCSSSSAA